ncbi:MAG: FkbM family methyltransferase [Dehalococcoidia bacterium]|nr:FkbM family methyltransferase [Dehalococcoidia bacterium]
MHLSNCRKLILNGWQAVLIEGEPNRFNDLVLNYRDNPLVVCVNRFIDDGVNRLDHILKEQGIPSLDFLSIDIDGLDYEILETLDTRPRVICIEVIVGNDPRLSTRTPRDTAKNMVGQSLHMFVQLAEQKGYGLVCYTFNAFFVRHDIIKEFALPVLSAEEAYVRCLEHADSSTREWLYLYNLGLAPGFCHKFNNPYLTRTALGITACRARQLLWRVRYRGLVQSLKKRFVVH